MESNAHRTPQQGQYGHLELIVCSDRKSDMKLTATFHKIFLRVSSSDSILDFLSPCTNRGSFRFDHNSSINTLVQYSAFHYM